MLIKGTIQQFAHAQLALQISIPVPSCTGTVIPRSCWSATICTTWTLLEHQALTPRTPQAVGSPLMPDPDQVSKHASLVPRPRVWLSRQAARGSSLTNQIARNHVVDIWIMISLADYSSWRHDLSTRIWPLDSTINVHVSYQNTLLH